MASPQLYVVMPVYNAAATLSRAVGSLACIAPEHRRHVHLFGVDDGSSDDSAKVFERTAASVEGIRWTLLRRTNGGSGAARNDALRSFETGWTLFLDADDELIADPFPALERTAEATALLFETEYYRERKSLFRLPARHPNVKLLPQIFSAGNPYCTLSIIFRRELLDGLFAEDLRFLEDWYFLATNPRLFTRCAVHRGIALGRVHGSMQSKSADQYKNGYYRVLVAERLAENWAGERSAVVRNNLVIQSAIGKLQMGEHSPAQALWSLPATPSLYAKLLVYRFAYRLYLRLYPYA